MGEDPSAAIPRQALLATQRDEQRGDETADRDLFYLAIALAKRIQGKREPHENKDRDDSQ